MTLAFVYMCIYTHTLPLYNATAKLCVCMYSWIYLYPLLLSPVGYIHSPFTPPQRNNEFCNADRKMEARRACAHVELWFWCFGPLQQQSHAMSVCKNANRTGLTLSMPSSNRCLAEARFKQIFLDASIGKTNQQTVQDTRGKAGRTCGCPHDG